MTSSAWCLMPSPKRCPQRGQAYLRPMRGGLLFEGVGPQRRCARGSFLGRLTKPFVPGCPLPHRMDHATARDLARRIAALLPDLHDALLFIDILGPSPRDPAARAGVELPTLLGRRRSARASLVGAAREQRAGPSEWVEGPHRTAGAGAQRGRVPTDGWSLTRHDRPSSTRSSARCGAHSPGWSRSDSLRLQSA